MNGREHSRVGADDAPRLESAAEVVSPFGGLAVGDVMHAGIITCPPRASLREVARNMVSSRVHAIVVWGDEENDAEGIWGLVSDTDLVAAVAEDVNSARSAVGLAGTNAVTVSEDASLQAAAELMHANAVTHLVVVSGKGQHPIGVLSALDLARAAAEARGG